jgi:hypothetical protein
VPPSRAGDDGDAHLVHRERPRRLHGVRGPRQGRVGDRAQRPAHRHALRVVRVRGHQTDGRPRQRQSLPVGDGGPRAQRRRVRAARRDRGVPDGSRRRQGDHRTGGHGSMDRTQRAADAGAREARFAGRALPRAGLQHVPLRPGPRETAASPSSSQPSRNAR